MEDCKIYFEVLKSDHRLWHSSKESCEVEFVGFYDANWGSNPNDANWGSNPNDANWGLNLND